ncbi:MAG: protein kinase domain-containing protein [Myxococcota bacterium]
MSADEAPSIAGKYKVLRKLGAGGMAEVFLAKQTGLEGFEKLVVIKRILPHLAEDQGFVRMFLDEARAAADLRHANVVSVFDVNADQGTYYMAMEFLHGHDLRQVQRRAAERHEALPLGHLCQIIIDAAAGLHYAHTKRDLAGRPLQLVHRDISPQNILVTYEGATKIVDFGIAKAASQESLTETGVIKGKCTYMSPEQAEGADIDHRSDQFALGVVMWELLTMRRLFKRPSEVATLNAIIECDIPRPSRFLPELPRHLDDIVMQCLRKDPGRRFDSCGDLGLELEEFLAGSGIIHSPARVGHFMREYFADDLAHVGDLGKVHLDAESLASLQPGYRPTTPPSEGTRVERARSVSQPERIAHHSATTVTRTGLGGDYSPSGAIAPEPSEHEDEPTAITTPETVYERASRGASSASLVSSSHRPTLAFPRRVPVEAVVATMVVVIGVVSFFWWVSRDSAQLTVRSTPSGAEIALDGVPTGRSTPHVFKDLERGAPIDVEVSLKGHVSGRARASFEQESSVELMLPLAVVTEVAPADTSPPMPQTLPPGDTAAVDSVGAKPEAASALVVDEIAPPAGTAPKSTTAATPSTGKIRIQARQGLEIRVDGRRVGKTPVQDLQLPAGKHRVEARDPRTGRKAARAVTVRRGQRRDVRLEP